MDERLTIAGGLVVTPAGAREADIVVENGRIAALEPPRRRAGETLDARGLLVLPGGVDPHAHLLTDIGPATVSAAFGGTTTVLSFTAPRPGEPPADAYARARDEQLPLAAVDVGLHPSVWEPERLTRRDLEQLRRLGAASVKLFLGYPELGMMASDRALYETLRDAAALGLLVQVHCENGGAVEALVEELLTAGRREARAFAASRPPEVEEEAVGRTLALAALARAPVYLVHLSSAGALAQVREARARGQAVLAEACTPHLVLDASLYERADPERFLVVPPLRAREHVDALWAALADGTLDAVGSDHAQAPYRPPPADDFTGLPYGLPAVEARLPLLLSRGRERGLPLERLAELAAAGPARAFGLAPRKGAIVPGADADLALVDPQAAWTIEPAALHDGLPDTPYAGLRVRGRIRYVLLRGRLLVAEGELVGPPAGSYLAAA